jgi:hypothetical protein
MARVKPKGMMEMTVTFPDFRVTALLNIGVVVHTCLWSGESTSFTIQQYCDLLERVAAHKRNEEKQTTAA